MDAEKERQVIEKSIGEKIFYENELKQMFDKMPVVTDLCGKKSVYTQLKRLNRQNPINSAKVFYKESEIIDAILKTASLKSGQIKSLDSLMLKEGDLIPSFPDLGFLRGPYANELPMTEDERNHKSADYMGYLHNGLNALEDKR
jgi:hypothetical protein